MALVVEYHRVDSQQSEEGEDVTYKQSVSSSSNGNSSGRGLRGSFFIQRCMKKNLRFVPEITIILFACAWLGAASMHGSCMHAQCLILPHAFVCADCMHTFKRFCMLAPLYGDGSAGLRTFPAHSTETTTTNILTQNPSPDTWIGLPLCLAVLHLTASSLKFSPRSILTH